ncbi:Type II secretion system F domain protein [Paraburkholderia sp. UCT31]|uniref:type II secretion system F family protein n=1 Tax=Paraburkholderia sp. UCT31 TaxID=2615209 RepID=UPI0016550E40|nr:type II secretion system F family protein [Paraburkholderia sp. UCT31]MBC8738486.1 Type II secretion system F domain protein [Paraburkholderia sp. UCT31]
MPTYRGTVSTREGVKNFTMSAKSESEAKKYFERSGRVIAVRRKMTFSLGTPLNVNDRQIFFTRLASMLASRVGTSEALRLIRDNFSGKIHDTAGRLLNYVEAGEDLSSAIEKIGAPDFPESTVALIKAGARSGETWKAIKDAVAFEIQLYQVNKNASKGLWSGVGALFFAGALTVGSTLYVGPAIMNSDLIKSSNKMGESINLDWVNTSGMVIGAIIAVLLGFIVLLVLLASLGRKVSPVGADKLIMCIPYYKDLVLSRNNFIVLYGLSLLVSSGVRMVEALRLSAANAPPGALKRDLLSALQAVQDGQPWPAQMKTLHATDKAALASASDRTQIANTLSTLANQYRELYAQRLGSFVPTINMLAAVFMSLAGGLLFAESIMPMLMSSKNML